MGRATFMLAWVLAAFEVASAQDWTEYQSAQDAFSANFPGEPKISETSWKSENGYDLPARVYDTERGKERYTVTVVDYTAIEQQGIERAKRCPTAAETCIGNDRGHGPGYWKHDMNGAVIYATGRFLKRTVTVTELSRAEKGPMFHGHELHFISNSDQSQTFVFIGMLNMKLYIVEGTVPKDYPPPALFLNSLEVVR